MNDIATQANNPFPSQLPARAANNAQGDAGQQRAIAEVQAAMVIAKRFPRDPVAAMDRILNACTRPTLAEGALYSYSKGGSDVTGPSIRLAEAMAQSWGNIDFGIVELDQRYGESSVMAYAWDLETNTRATKEFVVEHFIQTKGGRKQLTDPRDIYELVANQGARRVRNCILSLIDGDMVDAALRQCDETLKTAMGATGDQIKKMATAFVEIGVTGQMIEKRLGHRLDSAVSSELVGLRKIYTSIRDGFSTVADWFEVVEKPAAKTARDAVVEKAKEVVK
jgi:hypothetical protein